jgi:hypothetical protein
VSGQIWDPAVLPEGSKALGLFKKFCFGPKGGLNTPAERKFKASTTKKSDFPVYDAVFCSL